MRTFTPERPLVVAHRAGNSLRNLRRAEAAGADLVEADVFVYRDALEVRHSKTMGPIPLLWDRWSLEPAWRRRLSLADVARAAQPGTMLMLDLKRFAPGFPESVMATMASVRPGLEYWVCSQAWDAIEPFEAEPSAHPVYSVGGKRALRRFRDRFPRGGDVTVSIHNRLLTPDVVDDLRGRAAIVMTWPINSLRRLRELQSWGVNGITTDRLEIVALLARERGEPLANVQQQGERQAAS